MIPELSSSTWVGIVSLYIMGAFGSSIFVTFIEELDLPEQAALVTVWPLTLSLTVIWFVPTGLLKLARRITA